jgi:hypothetical protein
MCNGYADQPIINTYGLITIINDLITGKKNHPQMAAICLSRIA